MLFIFGYLCISHDLLLTEITREILIRAQVL